MRNVNKIKIGFVFWTGDGKIVAHLLYEFLASKGIGIYFPNKKNKKNSESIIVMINGNIVSPVNVGYLLYITINYILECTKENGESGPIIDSLHKSTSLFGDKNLKLLPSLKLEFISDTAGAGFFFFRNGVVKVTGDEIQLCKYEDFDQHVWEKSIIPIDFVLVDHTELELCDFRQFLKDLTIVDDDLKSEDRLKSLSSSIGYLLHRYKNPTTTKAIILMDVYINGMPNGGSGKTLLINSIGKIRNLSTIDGKRYDQKEWFGLSSVEPETEVLTFDDVEKNFNFELIFPLMSTGMFVRRKYKDHVFVPFEKSPKVSITTNYAINGNSDSFRRRMFEFELSATYSANYSPRDKFGRNFFSEWDSQEWNSFYNTMLQCLQLFLKEGLIDSEPINLNLTKLINKSSEEFVDWIEVKVVPDIQCDKKVLYDSFLKAYPEFSGRLKQREFTLWMRAWADFKRFEITEGHSGDIRYVTFSIISTT